MLDRCCSCKAIQRYFLTCTAPSCERRGLCTFPHGTCYSIMAIASAVGGVFMNVLVVNSCYFSRIQLINPVTGEVIPGSERGYGFRGRETDYGLEPDYGADCSFYSEEEMDIVFDGYMTAGKAFAWLSFLLASIACLVLLGTCMLAYSGNVFERYVMWLYIFATICIALSFLAFGSEHCQENKCKVAPGSGYAISVFMFFLSSANTVKSMGGTMPRAPKQPRQNPFRRRNNNHQDENENEEDFLRDMYYENEQDKYPLPETTPEGRKRYAHAEAYANEEPPYADRDYESSSDEEDSDDDDEYDDDDDDEYDSEEEGSHDDYDDNESIRNNSTETSQQQELQQQPKYSETSEHGGGESFEDEYQPTTLQQQDLLDASMPSTANQNENAAPGVFT